MSKPGYIHLGGREKGRVTSSQSKEYSQHKINKRCSRPLGISTPDSPKLEPWMRAAHRKSTSTYSLYWPDLTASKPCHETRLVLHRSRNGELTLVPILLESSHAQFWFCFHRVRRAATVCATRSKTFRQFMCLCSRFQFLRTVEKTG